MNIVKIDRNNQLLFKDLIFYPEQALAASTERIGIMEGNEPCGALVYSNALERLRLHSIFVKPDRRRRRFGAALMKALFEKGRDSGAMFITGNFFGRQEAMRDFLLAMGFVIVSDPGIYYFPAAEAAESEYVRKWLYEKKYSGVCKSFLEISEEERDMAERFLSAQGYPPFRLKEPGFQYGLSFCCFDSSGSLQCLMLVFGFHNPEDTFGSSNEVIIDYLLGSGRDMSPMMLMFRRLLDALKEMDIANTMVVFQAERSSSESIAEKLLGRDIEEADFVCHAVRELF